MPLKATEVFVPSDYPTITYVKREDRDEEKNYEKQLRQALSVPGSPISISGPSKTGKTAFVRRVVGLAHNDLWRSAKDPRRSLVVDSELD